MEVENKGIKDIKLDKRQAAIIIGAIFAGTVFVLILFVYRPLAVKIRLTESELETIEQKLVQTRGMIKAKGNSRRKGRLITRKEISLSLDEITRTGRMLNINFISINPREIERLDGYIYQRLPIYMDLKSKYKDIGIFLGALEELEESIVTVRKFEIETNKRTLPLLKSKLVLEMYLESEDHGRKK